MNENMNGFKRTCMNGTINGETLGTVVSLTGWAMKVRNLGSLLFVDLRDRSGIVQIVFDSETTPEVFKKASKVRNEYVLAVKGEVKRREAVNPKMPTGEYEVYVSELRILSESESLPIQIDENFNVSDANRLKYRYLDLRRPLMQKNFILRHQVAYIAREYFNRNGFLEIETPMLTKSTPEGARDYLVPSRLHEHKFYALPQSPQLFKQLL
ncbi:MAG: Asp-tRNA(Asn)/Glu-tRNA(Gln) amidotransferase GatCAB subunit C, partial [Clostridiales bacterium]|nr:Asp-tRNA(Asn)/Glu-tRNA(Gln) amidotransferase GatCAB subunit C [Clostridiales bacterium]